MRLIRALFVCMVTSVRLKGEMQNIACFLIIVFAVYMGIPSQCGKAQSIDDVLGSYATLYERIDSWEGEVEINESKFPRSGKFSFRRREAAKNSFNGDFFSRVRIQTTANIIDRDGTRKFERPHVSEYETLVVGLAMVSVDHASMHVAVPDFEFALRPDERPFTLGEKRRLDLENLNKPLMHFAPLYLFHGPSSEPHLLRALISESNEVFSLEQLSSGIVSIKDSQSRMQLEFERLAGYYVPKRLLYNFGGQTLEMEWDWVSLNSVAVPSRVRIKDLKAETDITYTIQNSIVNEQIPSERFDMNFMNFVKGDILADRIESKLYRYDGSQFVPMEDYGQPEARIQHFGLLLVFLGAFTAISLILFRGTRRKKTSPVHGEQA
jgi:hypothetical protein